MKYINTYIILINSYSNSNINYTISHIINSNSYSINNMTPVDIKLNHQKKHMLPMSNASHG